MGLGYSDRVNHAFAFAAKHHDQQVRKGTRLPYLTHPANVAVILCRYGRDEDTVVAGILQDVIEDSTRSRNGRGMQARVREKFGDGVVDNVLMVALPEVDDAGTPLSAEQQKHYFLDRLRLASESARWVCAADKIHTAGSLLADLRRTQDPVDRESIWRRFRVGKAGTIQWYRDVYERLRAVGFSAPIMTELAEMVVDLERWSSQREPDAPAPENERSAGTRPAGSSPDPSRP
jgi:(p)ppGpp synthase/HD superfamily hydrolase